MRPRTSDRSEYFETWDDARFDGADRFYAKLAEASRGVVRGDVLDVGCGSRIRYDTSGASTWVGLDLSAAELRAVKFLVGREPETTRLVRGSGEALPFRAQSFDTICSIFLLHHLSRRNRRESVAAITAAMAECRRVLRPGGVMFVAETWPRMFMHAYHAVYPMLYPLMQTAWRVELPRFFTPPEMERMALNAGFGRVSLTPAHIFEPIRQPVLHITLPAWMQRWLHSFAIYTLHVT